MNFRSIIPSTSASILGNCVAGIEVPQTKSCAIDLLLYCFRSLNAPCASFPVSKLKDYDLVRFALVYDCFAMRRNYKFLQGISRVQIVPNQCDEELLHSRVQEILRFLNGIHSFMCDNGTNTSKPLERSVTCRAKRHSQWGIISNEQMTLIFSCYWVLNNHDVTEVRKH